MNATSRPWAHFHHQQARLLRQIIFAASLAPQRCRGKNRRIMVTDKLLVSPRSNVSRIRYDAALLEEVRIS